MITKTKNAVAIDRDVEDRLALEAAIGTGGVAAAVGVEIRSRDVVGGENFLDAAASLGSGRHGASPNGMQGGQKLIALEL